MLPVTVLRTGTRLESVVMDQDAPVAGRQLGDLDKLAAALGLAAADLATDRAPCQVVSTGVGSSIVCRSVTATLSTASAPTQGPCRRCSTASARKECYVFSLDPGRAVLPPMRGSSLRRSVSRPEDPATGTAAGPLATHLVANGLAEPGLITIEQGTAMGRTSLIQVEVLTDSVRLAGRGVVVASGRLTLPH